MVIKKGMRMFLSILVVMASYSPFSVAEAAPSVTDCLEGDSTEECSQGAEGEGTPDISEESGLQGEEGSPQSPNLFLNLIKLVFALGLVLALIYFLLKFINGRSKLHQKVRALENLGGITLGSQKSLQVVRIGEKIYVIGVGDNVDMLTEITDEQTKKELLSDDGGTEFDPSSILNSLGKRRSSKGGRQNRQASTEAFSDTFHKELHELKRSRNEVITRYQQKDEDNYE